MQAFKSYFTPVTEDGEKSQSHNSTPGGPAKPPKKTKHSRGRRGKFKNSSDPPLPTSIELSPTPGNNATSGTAGNMASISSKHDSVETASLRPSSAYNTPGRSTAATTTPAASRPPSFRRSGIFPHLDAANSRFSLVDAKNDMMVKWLYEQQLRKQYVNAHNVREGVVLKKARGDFTCAPEQMAAVPDSLYHMVTQMNVRCAMTVNTPVVRAILRAIRRTRADVNFVPLSEGLQVQIIPTMTDLPRSKLHHFAAFVEDAGLLVVWEDDAGALLDRVQFLEVQLVEMIWGEGPNEAEEGIDEKTAVHPEVDEIDPADLEDALAREHRPVQLTSAAMVGLTLALCITCLGLGWRALVIEISVDGSMTRLALLAVTPVQLFVSLFFFQALVGNLFQIFGPISAMTSNSKYYSGKAPRRLNPHLHALPHVTFQMPVYKEGLESVIKPTVISLKAAISTYEMQGGTANIFVNDDGMQLISDEQAQTRRDFYDEHNIGWVARPAHRPKPDSEKGEKLFLRRGKFKKASNMNYALMVSNRVEEKLLAVTRGPGWNQQLENDAYSQCLADVMEEDEGRTWAEGNIRIGDYILIIDSDTRVPKDCLLDAVSEMEQSPDVAIIQFSSGVMNVTTSFFELGVTWFTNLIYTAITFAVAAGDACPFVGHNAMLRWKAIQDAAAYTDEDDYEKFWSESHVSEDFDMALRLQVRGYSLRYAAYMGDGFKEGVSLTVYDELARWEKYAFGCNELLFHPFRFWVVRGPFTPLFRQFLFSCIPLPKKLTIMAYIGTYYAIAAAWSLSLLNYFLTGFFQGHYDKYYLDSFAIYISIVVVFTGLGNLALAVLRYRTSDRSLFGSLFENIKWIPMFTIFLGGISIHISQAILCHFFEIDMTWGATAKEVTRVNFGSEVVNILKKFKWTFLYCFACTGLMIAGVYAFPVAWQIHQFYSIYPLASIVIAHFALPVCLNPALMMFTW
ncbi:glycosyl transferase family group 2-domain-containing protein [Coniochaeta sp. 2T2.1]|nr:glycosyl transferase family group 2-domain-containing protein [Coniochaeta sp. 2T2.1]